MTGWMVGNRRWSVRVEHAEDGDIRLQLVGSSDMATMFEDEDDAALAAMIASSAFDRRLRVTRSPLVYGEGRVCRGFKHVAAGGSIMIVDESSERIASLRLVIPYGSTLNEPEADPRPEAGRSLALDDEIPF